MEEVWDILDKEYGRATDLCAEAVGKLTMMLPGGPTDANKFISLYRANNLTQFVRIQDLDNLLVIRTITLIE